MNTSQRGRVVELKAITLFMEAGFEVFANAAPVGPADLMVWDGETAYPIDTKKLTRYVRQNGSVGYSWSQKTCVDGVYYLGWCAEDGWMWLSEPPEGLLNVF